MTQLRFLRPKELKSSPRNWVILPSHWVISPSSGPGAATGPQKLNLKLLHPVSQYIPRNIEKFCRPALIAIRGYERLLDKLHFYLGQVDAISGNGYPFAS